MRTNIYLLNQEHWTVKRLQNELDDDQPIDFGDEDDGDDDPKPDDDPKKTPAAPPKAKGPPSVVRDEHVLAGGPSMDHMSKGTAGDGIIYLNDIGETVKLDVKGHPSKVGSDGRRFFRSSPRPRSQYTPEEWRALTIPDRIVAEKKEALEKEIERKKKEGKDKKKKDEGAGSSKDKKKKKGPKGKN